MSRAFQYESMGTGWEITIWDEIADQAFNDIKKTIIKLSQEFDETYSRFIDSSLIRELSTKRGNVVVPADLVAMLQWYFDLYHLSQNKLNPLVGTTLDDLGYDSAYSLKRKSQVRSVPDLIEAVEIVGQEHISLKFPVSIDIGALGKGYFIDKLYSFLNTREIQHFLINGSGDIRYRGQGTSIKAGLEDPQNPKKVIGVVEMEEGSMCSSGSNRRVWGNHHHIVDPQSLTSPTEIIATWVIAQEAVLADALATAFFLVPPESFMQDYSFEYCLLNKERKIKKSKNFYVKLYNK